MSTDALRDIRGYLCSSANITDLVGKDKIRVGWQRELDVFPSIILTQVAGSDIGYLGYRTGTIGSRVRREENTVQVDIFSRDSRQNTYQISDQIVPLLIASGACRKNSDIDMYDDTLGVYRKVLSFSFIKFHDD